MANQTVIRIEVDSMTEEARWTGGPGTVLSLISNRPETNYLYAGLDTDEVVLLIPGTMEAGEDRWTGAAGETPQTLARLTGG